MGPLQGVRVVEIASLAPAPFGAMLLADLGAEVIRVDRPGGTPGGVGELPGNPLDRGKRTIRLDLKSEAGLEVLFRLIATADVFVEGFRPGVTERLGIGPDVLLARNPRLVYARMTGWGQTGPLAMTAGHDIDYIAIAGALEPIGRAGERPVPPLNLLGDFGGGGLLLAYGVLAALFERERSGEGQVVDAAMVDGAAMLTTFLHGMKASGGWPGPRGTNLLDGGAPFYDTYETSDGRYVAVGALEPQFYAALIEGLELPADELPAQLDAARWPELRARIETAFRKRSRDEWEEVFAGTDACVSPVLTPDEAVRHEHIVARDGFVLIDDVVQPAPAPRFSRTPAVAGGGSAGSGTADVLAAWGFAPEEIADLNVTGTVG